MGEQTCTRTPTDCIGTVAGRVPKTELRASAQPAVARIETIWVWASVASKDAEQEWILKRQTRGFAASRASCPIIFEQSHCGLSTLVCDFAVVFLHIEVLIYGCAIDRVNKRAILRRV